MGRPHEKRRLVTLPDEKRLETVTASAVCSEQNQKGVNFFLGGGVGPYGCNSQFQNVNQFDGF